MSYQLKRIDPFWHTHPMIPTGVAIGAILALIGYSTNKPIAAVAGGVIAGIAIIAAARPVVSALLGSLGLFGGLVTFVFVPNLSAAGMTIGMKLVSALLFSVFYMVLMDALVLVIAVLYNLFGVTLGLGGLKLDLEAVEETAAE